MPTMDLLDTAGDTLYPNTGHSFAFVNKKSSSSRKQHHSRQKQYSNSAKNVLDIDDERVELYSRPSGTRTRDTPSRKHSNERQRSRQSSQQSAPWDENEKSNSTGILASFPFHASSFQDNSNDHDSTALENVYDYEINEGDLYKYSPKTNKQSNNRNLSAGACRRNASEDEEIFDRPPSRQCHAFPIHLVDDDKQHTKSKRRPPSRHKYLARTNKKIHETFESSCEINEQSLQDTINRFRSRRDADRQSHDPTRDGFEAVDENAPLPFRIEVTTHDKKTPNLEPRPRQSNRRQRAPVPPPSAAYDDMRRTLQSRAEDPVIVKIAPDRRRSSVRGSRDRHQTSIQWDKDEASLHYPFFESTEVHTTWIPSTLDDESPEPETNSDGPHTSGAFDDLKLDDFNFSSTPPAPPDQSLRTSLGMDFLSLFAQS